MLHTFAAGSQFPSEQSIPLLTQAKRYGYLYQPGEVNDINPLEKKITLAPYRDAQNTEILPERTLHYDYLVVAIGSKSNDFNTKGVKEFAYTIDDLPAAMRFNREFTDSIIQSAILQKKHHLAIVGAGAAGVELSGEIINQILTASNYSNDNFMDYIDVTIIQADDRVVPTFKDSISEAVKHTMEKIGIRIRLSTRVSEVTKDSVILENGETLKADQVVWAAGVKAPEVLSKIKDLALSPTSQLIVNEHFQAIYLGNHFFKMMMQQTNIPSFKYVDKGSLVSIGTYASFGMFGRNTIFRGLEFRGLSAKIAHISLYRQHQMRLLGFFKGLSAWISDRFRKWSR